MDQEGIIEKINSRLAPGKKIKNVDVTWDFNYGFNFKPESRIVNTNATPSVYSNGTMVEGGGGRKYFESFLKGYLETKGDIKRTYFDEYYDL